MGSSAQVERHFEVTFTTVGAASEYVVSIGDANTLWELVYHGFLRSAGTAANYQPVLGEVTAPVAATMEHVRLNYAAVIAVATVTRDQFDPPIPFRADASGQLYYRPNFNAGVNNTAVVVLRFRKVRGSYHASAVAV